MASGAYLFWHKIHPMLGATLLTGAAFAYYHLGLFMLWQSEIGGGAGNKLAWGALAFALAALMACHFRAVLHRFTADEGAERQRLASFFAAAATAFVTTALALALSHKALPLALAGQMAVLCWLESRLGLRILRVLAGLLAVIIILLIVPDYAAHFFSSYGSKHLLASNPYIDLGLPALLFALASIFLRKTKDDRLVGTFEAIPVLLILGTLYTVAEQAFYSPYAHLPLFERGTITNIHYVVALGSLLLASKFMRPALRYVGCLIFIVAALRTWGMDVFAINPLWTREYVGELPLLNGLLLIYALPMLWSYLHGAKLMRAAAYVLGFICLTMSVRQLFHGGHLNWPALTSAEIYSYSAAWLAAGIALMLWGIYKKTRVIQQAAFVTILITVGKVFLIDTSALDGLYRVFSFLGLGLALLGLSWTYVRFIGEKNK
jgi:uncharacterized membrane protein